MANRYCENGSCGVRMSPMWPRKRMPNGELWCPGCALNHGRRLSAEAGVDGLIVNATTPTWGAEEAIRFDLGRQRVHLVTERADAKPRPMCEYHAELARQRAGLTSEIAYGTGLRDEGQPSPFRISPGTSEGRCGECVRQQAGTPWAARARPRHAPPERQEATPLPESELHRPGWPYRPRMTYERSVPVDTKLPPSLNSVSDKWGVPVKSSRLGRIAVRQGQGGIALDAPSTQRLAHFLAWDQPDIIKLAHDSGDSQTVFHCPFCGSGQVIARSDGTTECEFCHSAFTVQVQPEFPAFPQTIDGVPVNVPGMPSNTEAGAPLPGTDDESDMPPGADGEQEDEGNPAEGEDNEPAFLKGGFRTATGVMLNADSYLRHLAIACSPHPATTLDRIRERRGG